MPKQPLTLISILVWDGFEYVSKLLENLETLALGDSPYAIAILDQGSEPRVVDLLESFANNKTNVMLECLKKNKGFSAGHNLNFDRFWKQARFDYFVVVNSDAIFEEERWLDRLVGYMESHPETGGASPHVLGMQQNGHGRAASQDEIDSGTFQSISGCVAIYRVSDIQELGLFDTIFTPGYFEDTDLSFRFANYGRQMDYVDIKFKHCYLGKQYSTSGIKREELLAKHGQFQEKNRIEFLDRWVSRTAIPENPKQLVQRFPTLYFPGSPLDPSRVIQGPVKRIENGYSYDIGPESSLIIHPAASIRKGAHFEIYDGGCVRVGKNVVVGVNNWLQGNGDIEIGENTIIGANAVLLSTMHGVDKALPVREQPLRKAKLTLEKDVFIGANVTLSAGIDLHEGAVVGSNSVVNNDVEEYTIVGGVPAKKIGQREEAVRQKKALAIVAVGNTDRPNRFNTHTDFYVSIGNALLDSGVETYYLCHPESPGNIHRIPPDKQILAADHSNIDEILDRIKPDWIYVWNGNSDGDRETQRIAKARGIPIIFSELGWFTQKDTVYFDEAGTNARSFVRQLDLNAVSEHPELDEWIASYLLDRVNQPVIGPDYVFVPLQDESDTNIIDFSPYSKMNDFVAELAMANPETLFVVRPHPKAPPKALRKYSNVKISEGGNLYDWLASARSVVGINSTVLLEALLLGKVVHSVGEGLISGLDVFFEYKDAKSVDLNAAYDDERFIRRRKLLSELIFRRQFSRRNVANPSVLKENVVLAKYLGS